MTILLPDTTVLIHLGIRRNPGRGSGSGEVGTATVIMANMIILVVLLQARNNRGGVPGTKCHMWMHAAGSLMTHTMDRAS